MSLTEADIESYFEKFMRHRHRINALLGVGRGAVQPLC